MDQIKGVNLGGWFVLERWMKRSLFDGIDGNDETSFVTQHQNPKAALEKHWQTFITYEDFCYLKEKGINSLRLPIPWWLNNDAPYISPVAHIKKALIWAEELDLSVLLDLHTAPGSQNGFDNGGIEGMIEWHKNPKYIELTVARLGEIAKTFGKYKSLLGIEVLNEPHFDTDLTLIQDFYLKAYQKIRKHTNKLVVFHDAFRPKDESWRQFFTQNNLENVAFDLHLYHCFDEKLINGDVQIHLDTVFKERLPLIQKLERMVKVIIGEWSLGVRKETLKKDIGFEMASFEKLLASIQMYAYRYATGFYFWSYKIEHRDKYHGWDFKSLVENGILVL